MDIKCFNSQNKQINWPTFKHIFELYFYKQLKKMNNNIKYIATSLVKKLV